MIDTPKTTETLAFANVRVNRAPVADSLVLLVDAQERLVPAIHDGTAVIEAVGRLLRGAECLGIPIRATEHCPEAIGPTVAALGEHLAADARLAKRSFDAVAEPGIRKALDALGRASVVVAGVEAHVCVAQTALGLLATGRQVFVAEDACGSRRPVDREVGLARLRAAGCVPVTVEALLFEWLGNADNPAFKSVLSIIKEAR
ncbi:hydrolase [Thalassobaculum sp.]|uniref:hydrolase n=1 Tax=Thalassobaculum sp. TaxID=2022740 RepID=UPI0032EE8D6A